VTVVADSAWRAEVLAKSAFLAGPTRAAQVLSTAGATGLAVTDQGAVIALAGVAELL
jgi:thiamine biosynthesis lipoprotein ApbE